MYQRVKVLCGACLKPKEVSAYAAVMGRSMGCNLCSSGGGKSQGEDELADYVESLGLKIVRRDRVLLGGKELDIYIPELKLALEYNGDYWHSDEVLMDRADISAEEYHRQKLEASVELGIRLGFVWESEWRGETGRMLVEASVREFLVSDETPSSLLRLSPPGSQSLPH